MVVLRCTQKLLVRLKQVGDLPPVESTTRLGDWYGNILRIGRRQHLLFISERSRLPVVFPISEAKRLGTVFPDAVCQRLAVVGIAARDIADERMRMSEIGVRPDQEPQPAGHAERFRIHGAARQRQSGRTRVARGADAVPLADANSPVGRRKSDRVDASCVWASIDAVTATASRRSGVRLFGIAWARQDCPPALRGLDPPGALPRLGNYRSDTGWAPRRTIRDCSSGQ